jgi:hypothetical protein
MTELTSCHRVDNLVFDNDEMTISIDGNMLRSPLSSLSKRLLDATPAQRRQFEISASGYGIHLPEVDEDVCVEGLLRFWESAHIKQILR